MTTDTDDRKLQKHLSRFIVRRREELGMSQSDLARATGDSPIQVSRIERGLHTPSASFAIRISKALDVSLDELLGVVQHAHA